MHRFRSPATQISLLYTVSISQANAVCVYKSNVCLLSLSVSCGLDVNADMGYSIFEWIVFDGGYPAVLYLVNSTSPHAVPRYLVVNLCHNADVIRLLRERSLIWYSF